jgi:hypothetical protein
MKKPHDATIRRARFGAMESYARSNAVYSAKLEDRLYWQRNARFWHELVAQCETSVAPSIAAALEIE